MEEAADQWEIAILNKGSKWKTNISASTSKYCEKMTEFLGYTPYNMCKAYDDAIQKLAPEDFENSIKDKKEKWLKEMKAFFEQ